MATLPLKLELNIALIPNHDLARRLADASHGLAKRHPAIVQLAYTKARLAMAPHLTLYQVPLFLTDIEEAAQRLGTLTAGQPPFMLHATKYVYNGGEASFEVVYEAPEPLTGFQQAVIKALNPLRNGLLLERDPAGNDVHEISQNPGKVGENIRATGYSEVGDPKRGGLFRPHATLNWFELGTNIDSIVEPLPSIETVSGGYNALGMYLLGPHGTCPQILHKWDM